MYQEWQGQTTCTMTAYSVSTWPDRTAFLVDDKVTTFLQVGDGIARARAGLAALGVKKGDHVATLMGLSPRWADVFFGALSLGAIVVPLNLTWTPREATQGMMLTDSAILIAEARYRGQDLWQLLEDAVPEAAGAEPGQISSSGVPSLRSVIALRSEGSEGPVPSYAYDLDEAQQSAAPVDAAAIDPEDPALMLLTSGSTSFPKSAILSHRALLSGWATYADGMEIEADSVFVNCAPNYHVAGILTLGMTLMRGATDVMMRWFDPERALSLLQDLKASHFWGFDTHFAMMRDVPGSDMYDVSSVRHTLAASNAGASRFIVEMGFGHHGCVYGSTEFMGQQSYFPRRDIADTERMLKSNGRATCGELRITDIETGALLGPNEPGEICVRGPSLFSGYYKREDETAKCMDADGFFHSGDRGYIDERGYLYYQGRFKEMIKSGGENVSINEVEEFLASSVPGIRRVAVCATPHPKWGEAVTAVVVAADPGLTEEGIKDACRGNLAPYKIPKKVIFVDEQAWTVTPTGKINRQVMRSTALTALGISE